MQIQSDIVIRFQQEGFHQWHEATGERSYLAHRHRHLFHVEVSLEVRHDDREVELHDLRDFCISRFPGGEMGGKSCEQMAEELGHLIRQQYPDRQVSVGFFEDGDCGAVCRLTC